MVTIEMINFSGVRCNYLKDIDDRLHKA